MRNISFRSCDSHPDEKLKKTAARNESARLLPAMIRRMLDETFPLQVRLASPGILSWTELETAMPGPVGAISQAHAGPGILQRGYAPYTVRHTLFTGPALPDDAVQSTTVMLPPCHL